MYKVRVFFIFVGICTFFRNFSRLFFFVTVHEKKNEAISRVGLLNNSLFFFTIFPQVDQTMT